MPSNANLDLRAIGHGAHEDLNATTNVSAAQLLRCLPVAVKAMHSRRRTRQVELNVVVTRRVQAGKEEEVEAILRDLQAATLANDKGCPRYERYRASTPQTYMLLESWADQAAARRQHLKAPHVVIAPGEVIAASHEQPQAVQTRNCDSVFRPSLGARGRAGNCKMLVALIPQTTSSRTRRRITRDVMKRVRLVDQACSSPVALNGKLIRLEHGGAPRTSQGLPSNLRADYLQTSFLGLAGITHTPPG